jgi:hypothetical protein
MPPNSLNELFRDAIGLIDRAFNNIGNLVVFMLTSFIKLSPLPDEVDFLLICLLVIWLISFIIRMFRGKRV